MATTYSFYDMKGVLSSAVMPAPFIFQGQVGLDKVTIRMMAEQSAHDIAADGAVMVTAMGADNAQIELEFQQTSDLYTYLIAWFNILKVAKLAGNVTNWAQTSLYLQNITDGTIHNITGISPGKIADKPYAQQGQHITWTLWAADAQVVNVPV